jgi:hypothetical protein
MGSPDRVVNASRRSAWGPVGVDDRLEACAVIYFDVR